jgi:hypothetical protein
MLKFQRASFANTGFALGVFGHSVQQLLWKSDVGIVAPTGFRHISGRQINAGVAIAA